MALNSLLQDPADTAIGAGVGLMMRKMHVLGLSDFFIGSVLDVEANEVRIYFSGEVTEEKLKSFVGALKQANVVSRLEHSDEEGAEWMVVAASDVPGEGQPMTGKLPVQVSLTGEIPVRSKKGGGHQ